MGLIGGMARTAVVAGTATAVSNRVSRRQANRWQTKQDAQAYEDQQMYGQPAYAQPAYAPAPAYAQPTYAPAPPPPPQAAPAEDDLTAQLSRLGELNRSGVLTDAEFAAAKARLLGI
jgi:hypothetical protein